MFNLVTSLNFKFTHRASNNYKILQVPVLTFCSYQRYAKDYTVFIGSCTSHPSKLI